jgi:selenide,water dikinase
MNSSLNNPIVKHLVLVGGGHSHLAVLKSLGMKPVPGLAVTLISRDIKTPYSGSLPAYITGFFDFDSIHIDLRPLAQFAGARIIQEELTNIDFDKKTIELSSSRPNIEFDLISLNIGSKPDAVKIPGAAEFAIGIKPIDLFLKRWEEIYQTIIDGYKSKGASFSLAVVGGGPASIEFAFAAQQRINDSLKLKTLENSPLKLKIVSADHKLLKTHNSKVSEFIKEEANRRGIEILTDHRVCEFKKGEVLSEGQDSILADAIVFATGASIPSWPLDAGLNESPDGFIEVNKFLQTTSHDHVFAAGDAATVKGESRPKSGVFAVRQGKYLAENLIRYATGRPLRSYQPQKHALALINLGNKKAIASRNKFFFQGRSIWSLKNRIDSKFIRKYTELPEMDVPLSINPGLVDKKTEQSLKDHAMRCAGCGAKVASNVLEEVLQLLPRSHDSKIAGLNSHIEDASIIPLNNGKVLLQSVDQLKAFVNDPWLFAKIASNHCLSDIYAMGAFPHSALAIVGVPFASKKYTKLQLEELMRGSYEVLEENNCELIGGHSAESSDLLFGLCVNGFAEEGQLLSKGGMQDGDIIILTKALGTGCLLAADMRFKAKHEWIANALQSMSLSNYLAAKCFLNHHASACTDITGFGLAGHLVEMLTDNNIEVEINLGDVPVMAGALESLESGIVSSLHKDNALVSRYISNQEAFHSEMRYQLMFDPQTSGGLLASIPESAAEPCLVELHKGGYHVAKAIGRVVKRNNAKPSIVLR